MSEDPRAIRVAARLMKYAANRMGLNSCNDLPADFWDGWTKEERVALAREFQEWNSAGKDFNGEDLVVHHDAAMLAYFAHLLDKHAEDLERA